VKASESISFAQFENVVYGVADRFKVICGRGVQRSMRENFLDVDFDREAEGASFGGDLV